jgi:hypothetical protein
MAKAVKGKPKTSGVALALDEMTLFSVRNLATPRRPGEALYAADISARIRAHRFIDFDDRVPDLTKYLLGAVTTFYYENWIKAVFQLQGVDSEIIAHALKHMKGEFAFMLSFIMGPFSFSEAIQELKSSAERGDPEEILLAAERYVQRARRVFSEALRILQLATETAKVLTKKGPEVRSQIEKHKTAATKYMDDFEFLPV